MEAYWQQLIGLIVAPVVVVGAIAWLLRGFISQGFARDLQRYKSELDRQDFEHRERFSLIHQRRAEVIATFYGKIARTKSVVADLVGIFQQGGQSLIEKKKKAADIYNDMSAYFFENRIFLPHETAEKAEKLVMAIRDVLIEFDTAQMGNDEYKPDQTGLWVQAFKRLRDEVPPILNELEHEFKELLGFIEKRS
jgi:hypothetical protein